MAPRVLQPSQVVCPPRGRCCPFPVQKIPRSKSRQPVVLSHRPPSHRPTLACQSESSSNVRHCNRKFPTVPPRHPECTFWENSRTCWNVLSGHLVTNATRTHVNATVLARPSSCGAPPHIWHSSTSYKSHTRAHQFPETGKTFIFNERGIVVLHLLRNVDAKRKFQDGAGAPR